MNHLHLREVDERIVSLLARPLADHAIRFATMDDEFATIVAVLAVEGREGVFIGYGTTKGQASASAWENMRDRVDREGRGYPLP